MAVIVDQLEPFGTHHIGYVTGNEVQRGEPFFAITFVSGLLSLKGNSVN